MGVAPLGGAMCDIMGEWVDPRCGNIWVPRKIPIAVEQGIGIAPFESAVCNVVCERIDLRQSDVAVLRKVPRRIEHMGLRDHRNAVRPAAEFQESNHQTEIRPKASRKI